METSTCDGDKEPRVGPRERVRLSAVCSPARGNLAGGGRSSSRDEADWLGFTLREKTRLRCTAHGEVSSSCDRLHRDVLH